MLLKEEVRESIVPGNRKYRVVSDAVVGGGFDLRADQVVEHRQLGDFAEALIRCGALSRMGDEPVGYAL